MSDARGELDALRVLFVSLLDVEETSRLTLASKGIQDPHCSSSPLGVEALLLAFAEEEAVGKMWVSELPRTSSFNKAHCGCLRGRCRCCNLTEERSTRVKDWAETWESANA